MKMPPNVIFAVAVPASLVILLLTPVLLMRGSADMGACAANLKQIDGMTYNYMVESKLKEADSYSFTNKYMVGFLKGGVLPLCPSGGSYLEGKTFKDEPDCSIHGSLSKIMAQLPAQEAKERKKVFAVMGPVALLLLLFFWRRTKINASASTD